MDNKPTTLLFAHYGGDWIRGSERVLLDLLRHLDRNRFRPLLWCNSQAMAQAASDLDLPVYRDNFSLLLSGRKPHLDLRGFASLVRRGKELVDRHEVDLIHSNSAAPNQWLNPMARSLRKPLLIHLHSRYPLRERVSLGIHQASMVVGVSQPVIEPLLADGMPSERARVIANGVDDQRLADHPSVDLRQSLQMHSEDFLIISTGSLIRRKGMDLIIDALARLKSRGIPAKLAIIGEGPERQAIEKQIQRLGLQQHIRLLGERNDVGALLRGGADLFVSGAREEVFGLVLAEAGLAGLPVVAPRVGGIPGVISEGETGLLAPPGNPAALAARIEILWRNPERRHEMGRQGRQRALERFSIETHVQRFEDLYQTLLNDPSARLSWHNHWQGLGGLTAGIRRLAGWRSRPSLGEATP